MGIGVTWDEGEFPAPDGVSLYRRSALPPQGQFPCARLGLLTGYGDHGGRYRHFMEWMALRGFAVHALDFRGQGKAGGRRLFVSRWEEYEDDLAAFLSLETVAAPSAVPLFLVAQSHGALVAARSAMDGSLQSVSGCVFTAPYFRMRMPVPPAKMLLAQFANEFIPWLRVPTEVPGDWMSSDEGMVEEDVADPLAQHAVTPRWFLTMQEAQDEALHRAGEFRLPLLLMVGAQDQLADNAAAAAFFQAAGSPDKTFAALSPCRHEPLRELDRETYFAQIHEWLCARIP